MKSVLNTIEVFGKANPDHPAIINIDGLITYKLLSDMIASAAIEIENMCLDKNKLVGILFLNSAYHLIFNMALAKAGLASVSLTIGTLPLAQKLNVQCIIADKGDFSTKIPIVTPTNEWFKRKQNKVFTSVETSSSRIVKVSFTSGSTGENKPIGFTERAIFYRLRDARLKVLSNEERMLCLFGIESNVGLMSALGCLQNGRTVCFVRTPEHALKMLQKLSITCVAGSVTHLSKLAEMCLRRGSRFASVRKVMSAGSFLSDDNLNKIHAVFPADVYDVYASTEAGTCGLNLRSIVANQKIWGRFAPCTGVEIMLGDHGDELGQIIVHSNSR
ncbi:MAG: hypothetical protein RLZZ09_3518 [Pseudomonadota bacterium]|jgi:acyl-coenzyme A synthetase/AMP-(fatty) acid ligase